MRKTHGSFVESHALFDADAAPDAKELGDERDLVRGLHLDAEFACKTVILRYNRFTRAHRGVLAGVTDPFLRQDMTMFVF